MSQTESEKIASLLGRLKQTWLTGRTRSIEWRVQQMKQLRKMISENEDACKEALNKDLGRGDFESVALELLPSILEIDYCLGNLAKWMVPTEASVPGVMAPATAQILYEPYGVCLVISAFNYPIQLTLGPLLGALMAGNCVVVKPSEMATASEALLAKLLPQYLDRECVAVVCGGIETTTALLAQPWDKIFFTGSTRVGKIVMKAAAEHLTPVSLELGGKSPTFIDKSITDYELVAQRLCWGKFSNAGQTCIAPDYVLVHELVYDKLVAAMIKCIKRFYGPDAQKSPDLSRIISNAHVTRLSGLLEEQRANVIYGGKVDASARYIEPTLIAVPDGYAKAHTTPGTSTSAAAAVPKVLQEEIFGPLLPLIKISSIDEGIALVRSDRSYDKPLSLYIYGKDQSVTDKIIAAIPSGGVLVNDCLFHFGNYFVPFGGVGSSGLGGYHGKFSFECFSHRRSVMFRDDHMLLDAPVRYPPYTSTALKIFRFAAGLPAVPPTKTIVKHLVHVAIVAVGAWFAHKHGVFGEVAKLLR